MVKDIQQWSIVSKNPLLQFISLDQQLETHVISQSQ